MRTAVGRARPGNGGSVLMSVRPGGNKHALVIDEADHFIGGLICDERGEGPPDTEALAIVQSASTAFLDAYLQQESAAMAYLNSTAVLELTNGRAEMLAR